MFTAFRVLINLKYLNIIFLTSDYWTTSYYIYAYNCQGYFPAAFCNPYGVFYIHFVCASNFRYFFTFTKLNSSHAISNSFDQIKNHYLAHVSIMVRMWKPKKKFV